uniref:Antimicrobial non-disulfide-bridged peptide 6 NDBP6 n=2 Tax=Scorpiones TaxID=6855 RepID=A0A059U8Z8_MESGB|nr:antimicrobial non-disulfide-bridged peptide 6 NDBP6 [Mesobuthus gibbosus]AZL95821.1 antimicrobial non-disulfide-bridged peptide [Didymocentrus krausi]
MSSKTLLVLLLVGVLVSTFFTADAYLASMDFDNDALEELDNLDLDDYFDLEPADFVLLDMWANMLENSDFDDDFE